MALTKWPDTSRPYVPDVPRRTWHPFAFGGGSAASVPTSFTLPSCYPATQSFSQAELAAMQTTHKGHYNDVVRLYRYTGKRDAYNVVTPDWEPQALICAGFHQKFPARESLGSTEVPVESAELRLPWDTDVRENDLVEIVYRHGQELDEKPFYTVTGGVNRGPTGLRLALALDPRQYVSNQVGTPALP